MEFNKLINKIMKYNCHILDIGDKIGTTSYIDFIKQTDLGENKIMKGVDCFKRPFIVFKATYIFDDNTVKKTFSTFFQRYGDSDRLWHICGHDGPLLFDTCGGARLEHLQIMEKLLYDGFIELDDNFKEYCNYIDKNPIKIVIE